MRLRWRDDTPPRPQQCAFQVIVSGSDPAEDGSFMIVVDIDGPALTRTLGSDRAIRLSGGARIQAQVEETLTGDPVTDYTVVISQPEGPGTLGAQNQDVTTDDGVIVERVYSSPTDLTGVGTSISGVTEPTPGVPRFSFTPGPTLVVDQKVTVTGFTTNQLYNGVLTISATGAGFFEDDSIAFTGTEAGGFFTFVEFAVEVF
jgi:hypothetical protein